MQNRDRPVDILHLDRYTGGNRALNVEILQLFETQCREMLAKLESLAAEAGDGKSWRETTHTLKGASRGVGAWALADAAAEAEKIPPDDVRALLDVLHRIKSKSCAVQLFIEDFLKKDGKTAPA